jgi:hypothetical protein
VGGGVQCLPSKHETPGSNPSITDMYNLSSLPLLPNQYYGTIYLHSTDTIIGTVDYLEMFESIGGVHKSYANTMQFT